ncbi:outer membrane beta-barrel protein [Litoribacter populi]|uniref:outer membrane beta-barrel protein n=1 Tax=Litoribacter populi TaxID=2598460 RepID=UPI00118026E7|nr:outer membrane beta-barrel protein [Litoribacter populi]
MKSFSKKFSANRAWMFGVLLVVVMGYSHEGWSQRNLGLEIRPGVNFPTTDLNSVTTLNTGFGIEGVISYNFVSQFGIYAGWSWNRFPSDESFVGPNIDFEETGYTYGIQYFIPFGATESALYFRAGGLWNHIEMETSSGDIARDTGHGFGWQVEAGLSLPISERWFIRPNVRYRSLSRDFPAGPTTFEANLNYISVGLGIGFGL